jgi:glycerate kinase
LEPHVGNVGWTTRSVLEGYVAHVLLAPDKFKGSLTAAQVAAALARGIRRVRPGQKIRIVPVADGGDGTVAAALAAGFHRIDVSTTGPTGTPLTAAVAVRGETAVIETAAACGLSRLPDGVPAPLTATSAGIAALIRAAIDAGCGTIVLGLGGSACTDGGAGLIAGLGGHLRDGQGRPLPPGGGALADLATVDLSTVDRRVRGLNLLLASDVDSPLLGPTGAAVVFGPQKGADPAQVALLERGLTNWAERIAAAKGKLVDELAGQPGAGAAGGLGFAALALLGAHRRSGIELLLDLVGFPGQLTGARLVITGEGSLDEQSLHGKAPIGVLTAAGRAGVPVVAVAGRCALDERQLADAGFAAAYPLTDLEPDPERSMAEAAVLVERVGERIATEWLA